MNPSPFNAAGRPVRRILIVRPSAIGDVVMASAMLPVLSRACPQARICWLVEPHIVEVLKASPGLSRIITWPKSTWRQLWKDGRWWELLREIRAFVGELRRERFDVVLDVQGLLRSRLLAWFTGAPVRIGFDSKEPGRFLLTRVVSRGGPSRRMGSEYYHLLRELGLEPEPFHPCLDIDGADAASAAAALRSAGVDGAFVALAPFTTRPQKHWLEERWRQLAGQVGSQCGLPVVVLGGPADRDAAERIFAGVARVTLLAGQLRLAETMAVIRQSALLIGVDTGLTHLGPAFARPTVALFGATCPYLETSRDHTVVIYHQQPCSPCRRSPTCAGQYPCMAAISVDEVLDQARQMLSTAGAPK